VTMQREHPLSGNRIAQDDVTGRCHLTNQQTTKQLATGDWQLATGTWQPATSVTLCVPLCPLCSCILPPTKAVPMRNTVPLPWTVDHGPWTARTTFVWSASPVNSVFLCALCV